MLSGMVKNWPFRSENVEQISALFFGPFSVHNFLYLFRLLQKTKTKLLFIDQVADVGKVRRSNCHLRTVMALKT